MIQLLQTKIIPIITTSSGSNPFHTILIVIGAGLAMLFCFGIVQVIEIKVDRDGTWENHGLKKEIKAWVAGFLIVPVLYWLFLIFIIKP